MLSISMDLYWFVLGQHMAHYVQNGWEGYSQTTRQKQFCMKREDVDNIWDFLLLVSNIMWFGSRMINSDKDGYKHYIAVPKYAANLDLTRRLLDVK